MKDLFRGYYKLTEDEIENIWSTGFISFDTNVLFNIYRYSEDTRNELIKVITKYTPQLWLTYQTAYEFHKNRITVITDQIKTYDETIKSFKKLEDDIVKNLKAPHLSKAILGSFEKVLKEIIQDLEQRKDFYKGLLTNDTILEAITNIFDKKVGAAFSMEEIKSIEKLGEERYKQKIPPGYKDNEKSENKFGDLIIWKELIRRAKENGKSFILIIDDLKEDWWLRAHGQKISPRHELSQEVYNDAQQLFHLYTTDRFLEFASKTEVVKPEAIEEVKENQLQEKELNEEDLSALRYIARKLEWKNPSQTKYWNQIGKTVALEGRMKKIFENYEKVNLKFEEIEKLNEWLNQVQKVSKAQLVIKEFIDENQNDELKENDLDVLKNDEE